LNPDNISPSRRQGIRKQAWLSFGRKRHRKTEYLRPIITTILARGYVVKEGKTLVPDRARQNRYGYYENYFQDIVDVEFTAQMEKTLDEVKRAKKDG